MKILKIIVGVIGVLCVVGVGFFVFGARDMMRRQYVEEDKFVTSYLNSRSFTEVAFTYKILSYYWDKYETSRGRDLVANIMLKKANNHEEELKEVYEITSGQNPDVKEKAKKELQKLGVSF